MILSKKKLKYIPIVVQNVDNTNNSVNKLDKINIPSEQIDLDLDEHSDQIELLDLNSQVMQNNQTNRTNQTNQVNQPNQPNQNTQFKVLYLNLNKIEKIENLEYLHDTLQEIHIQGNKIKNLDNIQTQNLTNLQKLDLANNELESLDNIEYLENLVYLNIENNNISVLKGNTSFISITYFIRD